MIRIHLVFIATSYTSHRPRYNLQISQTNQNPISVLRHHLKCDKNLGQDWTSSSGLEDYENIIPTKMTIRAKILIR